MTGSRREVAKFELSLANEDNGNSEYVADSDRPRHKSSYEPNFTSEVADKLFDALPSALTELRFVHGLPTVPASIGKFGSLTLLKMDYALDLEELPESIGSCSSLEEISLYMVPKFRTVRLEIAV